MARPSLAQSLAALSNVAPDDFDPEAGYDLSAAYTNGKSGSSNRTAGNRQHTEADSGEEEEQVERTSHYADVDDSKLRKRAQLSESDTLRSDKYAGVKSTLKDFYADGDGQENDDSEEEDRLEEDAEKDEQDEEDEAYEVGDDDDKSGQRTASKQHPHKTLRFASPQENTRTGPATLAAQSLADAELRESIRSRARADAIKGRAVRKQRVAWENVLQARIMAQKVCGRPEIMGGAQLPPSLESSATQPVLSQLADLSHMLFVLRTSSLSANHPSAAKSLQTPSPSLTRELEISQQVESVRTRKRARLDSDGEDSPPVDVSNEAHDRSVAALNSLEASVLYPLSRSVLDKWSSKVQSSQSGGAAASLGLKAVNQSAGSQVTAAMEGDGLTRLTSRTRVWRGIGGGEVNEKEMSEDRKADIFDDSDFYSHLLKELIESRGAAAGVQAEQVNGLVALQGGKKKKRTVDTRASKGRRIKYDVHPKLESFMPPIPRLTWNEDQFGKLLAQLAGLGEASAGNGVGGEVHEESGEGQEEDVQLAGLRLFG